MLANTTQLFVLRLFVDQKCNLVMAYNKLKKHKVQILACFYHLENPVGYPSCYFCYSAFNIN